MAPQKRTRWTERQARRMLQQARDSGLSLAEFSRQHGFNRRRLEKWRRKLEVASPSLTDPAFVELVPEPRPALRGEVSLRCPSGHVLDLRDVDVAAVLAVVLAGGTRSC